MAVIVPRRGKPFRHFGSPTSSSSAGKLLLLVLVIIGWSCLCGLVGIELSHLLRVCQ